MMTLAKLCESGEHRLRLAIAFYLRAHRASRVEARIALEKPGRAYVENSSL